MNIARARRGALSLRVAGAALALLGVGAALLAVGLTRGPQSLVRTPAGAGVAPTSATGNDRPFVTRDDVTVIGRQMPAISRGTVVLLQGLGEPDSLLLRWGEPLKRITEMNVIALALRGNGRSRDTVRSEGSPDRFALDIDAVVRELRRRNPSGPVIAVATHGGLGLLAAYERTRRDRDLLAFDGVVAVDGNVKEVDRAPDNRPFVLYARRARVLDALSDRGISWFDHLEVASQSADAYGGLATRWTYGSWRATRPSLDLLLRALGDAPTRALVLSTRAASAGIPGDMTWAQVTPTDLSAEPVQRALSRWIAEYAANAYEPVPPKATQTLDVLGRR